MSTRIYDAYFTERKIREAITPPAPCVDSRDSAQL